MHRTTIMLPRDLKSRAQRLARRSGMSLSELIRTSLEAALRGADGEVREDSLLADDAAYRGDAPSDLSDRHDEHLYGSAERISERTPEQPAE